MTNTEKAIAEAVKKHLPCIPTLERRGQDDLDFAEVFVPALKKALEEVYLRGVHEGMKRVVGAQKAGLARGTWSQECLREPVVSELFSIANDIYEGR
jgi:hypothetical protein